MSHSAKKCKRGDPLGFINIYSVEKYQKTRKGDSFETLKNFQKKSHNAEKKIEKRDTFALISADRIWPYGSSFSSFDCMKSGPIRVRL